MKLASKQVWQHKTDDHIKLVILDGVNKNYKVKIIGPKPNMHMIETVSHKYITSHYKFIEKQKDAKEAKK